jgi:hypothetical protein
VELAIERHQTISLGAFNRDAWDNMMPGDRMLLPKGSNIDGASYSTVREADEFIELTKHLAPTG